MKISPDPMSIYNEAYQERQSFPLRHPSNPYKLKEARQQIVTMLDTARAVLQYERRPVRGGGQDSLGGCLAYERYRWTRKVLGEWISRVLGRNAVPGLEVMARPVVLARFTDKVLGELLPAATAGLALPQGEPMMLHLVDLLDRTLAAVDETLAACEVVHA